MIDFAALERARLIYEHAGALVELLEEEPGISWPWDRDISGELATNPGPYVNYYLKRDGGWWQRRLDQIDAVTIHHTLSDSPHATAAHYVARDHPTLPYTLWVTQDGQILKCVDLTDGLWHDHTGHANTHLSVGLAGTLHLYHPAEVQLEAVARLCAWAIKSDELPSVTGIEQVKGHQDYIATICPGWSSNASGRWKAEFYERLRGML
jgi:hypothetical protein